jgi:hypothetical protein
MRGLALVIALSLAASAVQAQSLEDRLRSQLTATVAELRDIKANQAALAAQKDAAEHDRDALKADLAAARAKLRTAAAPRPETSDADLAKAKAEQSALDQVRLDAALVESRRLAQQLASLQGDQERQAGQLTANTEALGVCRTKHAQLTVVADDILGAYNHISGAGMLLRREPFTGLKRVKVQTRVQTFGDRLYEARLDVKPKTPPAAPLRPQQ